MITLAERLETALHAYPFRVALFTVIILTGITGILALLNLTFLPVDQLYCRNYLPFTTLQGQAPCSPYRAGDDILENDMSARELNYLRNNPYQTSFSERLMNGTPVAYAYGSTPYVPFKLLTRVLPHPVAANVAGMAYLLVSMIVGYAIGRLLHMPPLYSLLFGILGIPLGFMGLIDAGNLSLLSYGLIALGMLLFYKKDRIGLFIIITFLGSLSLLLGAMYQHYIYIALSFLLLGFFYWEVEQKSKFLLMALSVAFILVSTALLLNFTMERHLLLLTSSQKSDTLVTFWEMVKMKGYALDPLAWVGYHLPLVHRQLFTVLGGEAGSQFHAVIGSGIFSPGPTYLVLAALGFMLLFRRHKGYTAMAGFWFLYAVGIISFFLSIIIGDPFRSESSVRASNVFFLLANVAAVIGLQAFVKDSALIGKRFKLIASVFLGYVLFTSMVFLAGNYVLLEGTYPYAETLFIGMSALLGIIALLPWSSQLFFSPQLVRIGLIISLLVLPIGRLVLGATPFTFALHSEDAYVPVTEFEKGLHEQRDVIRVAMMQDGEKGSLHEVTPLWFETPTVNAYFNPIFKEYAELYQFHRLMVEQPSFSIKDFQEFARTNNYISNNLSPWHASTSSFIIEGPTKRFFELTQTNAIIAADTLPVGDPAWQKRVNANNLSLWVRGKAPADYYFTDNPKVITDRWERLDYTLNGSWNPSDQTIVEHPVDVSHDPSFIPASLTLAKKYDGYRLIEADVQSKGILSLPVNYERHWSAVFHTPQGTAKLQTLRVNYAFLGVVVPAGKGTLEIQYDDTMQSRHWLLAIAGPLLLIALFFLLRWQQKEHYASPLLVHPLKALKDIIIKDSRASGLSHKSIQFFRYGMVGVSNVILDFIIYLSLTRGWEFWREHYLWANFLSFVVVVTWSFFWNKHWTFQERSGRHGTQYAKFLAITVIGLGIYQTFLYAGIQLLSLYDVVAKLLAIPLMTAWNFIMHKLWTFKSRPAQTQEP